jgi:hypothetical protein
VNTELNANNHAALEEVASGNVFVVTESSKKISKVRFLYNKVLRPCRSKTRVKHGEGELDPYAVGISGVCFAHPSIKMFCSTRYTQRSYSSIWIIANLM